MISLRNPILATIIYYDCFDYPLSLFEVYKFLINPSRLTRIDKGVGEIKLSDIGEELDRLVNSKIIGQKNGFFFLSGREGLFEKRIERHKIAARKWKKFLRTVRILALSPYLKGVFASGSMALNNTEENSDFDLLVISKSGRLYTSRFFLWVISSVAGVRRKRFEKVAPDKLCFNHYITDESLDIRHESLFNAQTYSSLKPVMVDDEMIDRFFKSNFWINNYLYNFRPQKEFMRRSVGGPWMFLLLGRIVEIILNTAVGDKLEDFLKERQQERIRNNPATYHGGGRIVFTDQELEFHPYSFEKIVLSKYKQDLRRFGIISYVDERDSGLLP